MKERLGRSDYRFIAVCVALLALTTWYSARNFYRAFPEASIDFRVNRNEGEALGGRFLAGQGYQLGTYREASSFSFDDDAKTFLEREVGLERANQLMGTRVRLWRWSYRWYRPLQKEEFRADVTPRGEVAEFSHEIAEDAPRAAITAAQARSLAEDLLRTRMQRDPATLEFVEGSDVARPNRVDRVFTWKERDFELHGATNRVEVTVLGNEAGGYREYLKVPEQWTRDYQRLRSKNEVAQLVDSAVTVALAVGLVVVIVMRVRRQDIRWRHASLIGVVAMVLSFCSHLNQFSLQEFNYPTTDSYGSFMARQLLAAVISALGWGGLLFVLTAGAEPLYRAAFANQISLGNLFSVRALRTKRFFLGAILGITLTGIFIAYQTAFYIVASRFGAWSPAEVPYSDLLNTRFPWLFVLLGGFLPAISEEFLFRMFSIPFLKRLFRSTAVAIVLAGFIWGFGHAGYPQQPFFIRGVEVGIGGIALGLIMLRWGILPTLVWHYSVDAMYSAMLLIRSQSLYFRLSGAASAGIIVLPVVLALVAYWRHGGFESEAGLRNGDEERAPEVPAEAPAVRDATPVLDYRPLTARRRTAAVAVFAVGLAALAIPVSRFGVSPTYRIGEAEGQAAADRFLREQGLDPGAYRHVTFPAAHWGGEDSLAAKYFLERRPVAAASRLFEQYRPVQVWATRYFKPLDQDEVTVSVHPETGQLLGFGHTIPEDRAGADLSADAAQRIAAAFAGAHGRDVAGMELKESTAEKQKARRDHTLEWEAPAGDARNVEEARYRLHVEVSGDRVTAMRSYWKVPEAYARNRSRQSVISIAVMVLRVSVLAGGVVWGLFLVVRNIRLGLVRWGAVLRIAAPAAALTAVGPLLAMQLELRGYDTAIAFEVFQASSYVQVLMSAIFAFVLVGGAATLLVSFYPQGLDSLRRAGRRLMGIDALIGLLAAAGLGMLLHQMQAWLMDRLHAQALFAISSPDLIVSAAPAVAALAGAVRTAVVFAAVLGTIVLIAERLPRWMLLPMAMLTALAALPGEIRTAGEFALQYGMSLAAVGGAATFCLWFGRRNYLAYALVIWVAALRGDVGELLSTAVQAQGWVIVAVVAVGVAWAVTPGLGRRARAVDEQSAEVGRV